MTKNLDRRKKRDGWQKQLYKWPRNQLLLLRNGVKADSAVTSINAGENKEEREPTLGERKGEFNASAMDGWVGGKREGEGDGERGQEKPAPGVA